MIDWISEWVKNIVFIILLASFVDLLLPNSNMQKYARIVLGMLIVLIIITPVLEIFKKSFSIIDVTKEFESNYETNNTVATVGSIDSINQRGEEDYQTKMRKQVEINMEENLKEILEDKLNILITNLILKTEINYGKWQINQIIIYATSNSIEDSNKESIVGVKNVDVKSITLEKENTSIVKDSDKKNQKLIDDIKEIIEKEWDLKKEKIVVYLESDTK